MQSVVVCRECGAKLPQQASRENLCVGCLLGLGCYDRGGSVDGDHGLDVAEVIDGYRIVAKLGQGGMGVVYEAEQREPVRRTVAFKVIKRGMDTKEVVARFEGERQALALMDHPQIARVFDAGATPRGRPYFVMELVQGIPITHYCDQHRLTTRQRLELFTQVCDGVQHAHQKGVIHRDIKPGNVLVTTQDGRAVAKIIDFGVAKATAQRLTEQTLVTSLGQLLGTPEYMSPEQVELTSQDIDTRTDVYSLGVVLYELLVGVLPLESFRLRVATFDEVRRLIREEEPPKPSTRLSTLGGASARTSRKRNTDPATLLRQIRGDLDWIVMKALEKDRTRRYASASELAADVRRHLRHEPVSASPPSTTYRLQKFVRRHRLGVAAGAMAALALLLGSSGAGIGLVRAVRAEQQTRLEAERANQEAETAKQVSDFLVGLFEVSNPGEARGNSVTAREILDRGAEQIETTMSDDPAIQARLMAVMGEVYRSLGLYPDAEPLLRGSLERRRRVLGEDHPETLESTRLLGYLLQSQGKMAEAEDHFRLALDGRRRMLGQDHASTLESVNDMGVVVGLQGRISEAEVFVREALEGYRRVLGPDHPATLNSLNNIAHLMVEQGQPAEAEAFQREALESQRRTLGEDHPATLRSMNNVGYLLLAQDKLAETEPFYRAALEGRRRVLGDEHPETLSSLNNMGYLLVAQGRLAEAEPFYVEALEGLRRMLGPDHSNTLQTMGNLGDLYTSRGRFDQASALLAAAVQGVRRALPPGHVITGRTIRKYGRLLTGMKRYDEAERALLEAHEILVAAVGPRHNHTVRVIPDLVELYEARGEPQKAADWRDVLAQQ